MKSIKKSIRKFFNRPSKKESLLIAEGRDKMVEMAKKISSKKNDDEYNLKQEKDSVCPICKGTEIVNKISRVEGSGHVSGSFVFGSGSVYGSSSIDTNEVNHCNKCGNQWKKYNRTYTSTDNIIADWFNDLNTVFEGKYSFGDRTVELLKDIPAESLWEEGKRVSSKCYYSTRENITLSFLRTKFKSIYS